MSPNNKTPFKVYLLQTATSGPARLPAEGWPKTMIPASAGGDSHPKGLPSSPAHEQTGSSGMSTELTSISSYSWSRGTGSFWQHVGPCSPFLQPGDCGGLSFPHWRRTPVGMREMLAGACWDAAAVGSQPWVILAAVTRCWWEGAPDRGIAHLRPCWPWPRPAEPQNLRGESSSLPGELHGHKSTR